MFMLEIGMFISPIAILISAGISWMLAKDAINESKKTARQNSTLSYLSRLRWDSDYIAAKNVLIQIKSTEGALEKLAKEFLNLKDIPTNKLTKDQDDTVGHASRINAILNEYEAMATAIKNGAYDEDILLSNIRQMYLREIGWLSPYIKSVRNGANGYEDSSKIWEGATELCDVWRSREKYEQKKLGLFELLKCYIPMPVKNFKIYKK